MKTFLAVAAVAVVLVAIALLLHPGAERPTAPIEGQPWQVEPLPGGGSRVFGLTLAQSTIGDARLRFGEDMELGIIAARGEPGTLEAYYNSVTAGTILGKMILVAALDPGMVARLRERAVKREFMHDTTYRYILDPADLALAWGAPLAAITFIPVVSIDEQTALARFGPPQERVRTSEQVEHFLYPDKGLDLVLDAKGKEVLQYVAPREFERLRAPLRGATPSSSQQH
jgi:hypothetical protein